MRFLLLGGDGRMEDCRARLSELGHTATFEKEGLPAPEEKAAEGPTAIVLPLPISRDGKSLHCPLSAGGEGPALGDVGRFLAHTLKKDPKQVRLFGGKVTEEFLSSLSPEGERLPLVDYEKEELFRARNARISAEGAIHALGERWELALFEVPMMILGSGHFASALASLLSGMGVPHSVFSRRRVKLPEIPVGTTLPLTALPAELGRFSVILNTVPVPLLDDGLLDRLRPGSLFLELSGAFPEAERERFLSRGIAYEALPGIPGRYAKASAGRLIADTVLSLTGGQA